MEKQKARTINPYSYEILNLRDDEVLMQYFENSRQRFRPAYTTCYQIPLTSDYLHMPAFVLGFTRMDGTWHHREDVYDLGEVILHEVDGHNGLQSGDEFVVRSYVRYMQALGESPKNPHMRSYRN